MVRFIGSLVLALILGLGLGSALRAQEAAEPWQATVTSQIVAFRSGDRPAALAMAGAAFQAAYSDGERFMADVERAGYGPIVASRSHSFGPFRELAPGRVLQVVLLVGPERDLYEALYQMAEEENGWRVQGVVMRKTEGMGI